MHAEIDDTAAAGELTVVEPGLVRPVRVVEREIGCVDSTERAFIGEGVNLPESVSKAVRKVDPKKAVGRPRGRHYIVYFLRVSTQGFLAEDRQTAIECRDGLRSVKRAWSGDCDAVKLEREQIVKRC